MRQLFFVDVFHKRDVLAAMSRDDEMQRCETDAIYRMLSERPTSCDAAADAAAAAAGRDAEFDRTQSECASLQLQVLPSSQLSDSGRYCTSEGMLTHSFFAHCDSAFYFVRCRSSWTCRLQAAGRLEDPEEGRQRYVAACFSAVFIGTSEAAVLF